jgi:hypothetical protein
LIIEVSACDLGGHLLASAYARLADPSQRLKTVAAGRLQINRPLDDLSDERKSRRCSDLRRDLDVAESTVRNGAVHWQYNSAKARIPALQNQIKREC